MSTRTTVSSLVRRPARAIPVVALAVVLLAAGGTGIWLLGVFIVQGQWPLVVAGTVDMVAQERVDGLAVQITAVVVVVLGLLLLLAALIPGRPSRLQVLDDEAPGETAMSRRDVARRLQRQVENVDGVHSVSAEVGPKRIDVAVRTVVDDPSQVKASATRAVESAVAALRPATVPAVRVRTFRRR